MKHFGDITKIQGDSVPLVDVITGGSPCQDLSNAGRKAGLAGARSGLFLEQIRLIKEMREHERQLRMRGPDDYIRHLRFAIWENVPGAFSSNGGEDFRRVLEEFASVSEEGVVIPRPEKKWTKAGCIVGDHWSVAWRTMDAKWWGVPQMRRRIALLADFDGQDAQRILFEQLECRRIPCDPDNSEVVMGPDGSAGKVQDIPEGMRWYPVQSIAPWKGVARRPEESAGSDAYTLKLRHTGSDTQGGASDH